LDVAAVIPHEIDRSTVALKVLANRCVFYAIAVSEDHRIILIGLPNECKTFVGNDIVFPRLTVHLVCVTKYRRKVFDSKALEYLKNHGMWRANAPPPRRERQGFRREVFR
jgi:hypothetical protein